MKQLKFSLNQPAMRVRKMLAVVILGVVPVVAVGAALATPPLFFTGTPIALGTTPGQFKIKLQDSSSPADAAIVQVTQAVGGHSGWHAHPGPAVVIVKSGELTIQQAKDCSTATYTADKLPSSQPDTFTSLATPGPRPWSSGSRSSTSRSEVTPESTSPTPLAEPASGSATALRGSRSRSPHGALGAHSRAACRPKTGPCVHRDA